MQHTIIVFVRLVCTIGEKPFYERKEKGDTIKFKAFFKSWIRRILVIAGIFAVYVILYFAGAIPERAMQHGIRVFRIMIVTTLFGSLIAHLFFVPHIRTKPGEHINWDYDPEQPKEDEK